MFLRALLLLFLTFSLQAQTQSGCEADGSADGCSAVASWQISLAMGAGYRSNPLYGGHNWPLWLMPDFSYYDEHFFFDNGTVGYSWSLQPDLTLSLVSRLNEEHGFFRRHSAVNLFQSPMISDVGIAGPAQKFMLRKELSIAQVDKRPMALDAGLQLNWFLSGVHLTLNWWHDVSQQYDGQHLKLAVSKGWQHWTGHWQLGAALAWKDQRLMNTYYGLSEQEGDGLEYRALDSWQPEVSLQWSYPLNERWQLLSFWKYRWLNTDVEVPSLNMRLQSPLLQESSVRSWFVGLSYRFN